MTKPRFSNLSFWGISILLHSQLFRALRHLSFCPLNHSLRLFQLLPCFFSLIAKNIPTLHRPKRLFLHPRAGANAKKGMTRYGTYIKIGAAGAAAAASEQKRCKAEVCMSRWQHRRAYSWYIHMQAEGISVGNWVLMICRVLARQPTCPCKAHAKR